MLDIVAADQHQLALTIDGKRINNAESRLPRATAGNPEAMREDAAVNNIDDKRQKADGGDRQRNLGEAALSRPKVPQCLHS
jgi:hypothetical protein